MSGVASTITTLLAVATLAFVVRLVVQRMPDLSYSVVLVAAGVLVAALEIPLGIRLSHDVIMLGLLPVVLFRGAVEVDHGALRRNLLVPVVLVVVGLPAAIAVLGWAGTLPSTLDLPVLVSLLFAAMILPTDPDAVLSIFEELDAPDRLAAIVDGESLFNDGVAIVFFATFLELIRTGASPDALAAAGTLGELAFELVVVGGGGLLVGLVAGYVAHHATRWIRDRMATVLLTLLLAYGSYLVAEQFLGLSGVLGVVGAGIAMGMAGEEFTARSEAAGVVRDVWDIGAFLVNTLLYLLIGTHVRIDYFLSHLRLVVVALVLVVVVRAAVVYPLVMALDAVDLASVPPSYQHIMVWGGLHTVIPIALALSLPEAIPHREDIRTMVFGVAVLGLLVQGLLMPIVLRTTGATS